jgi:hypothetical protein
MTPNIAPFTPSHQSDRIYGRDNGHSDAKSTVDAVRTFGRLSADPKR